MPVNRSAGRVRRNWPVTEEERKALAARKARKEKNIREQREASVGRVSYVKKPFSGRSCICLALTAAALCAGCAGFYLGISTRGQAALPAGALGFCSILCIIFSMGYGVSAFRERDKKYILARIGLGADVLLLIIWAVIIIIGARG